ncbi:MAG: helix-hairpin-helix domain-containing protein [Myxococcota bacterium]|nr:helix-hairpin-helix domain-containing protein [Myxococcota bacterium]
MLPSLLVLGLTTTLASAEPAQATVDLATADADALAQAAGLEGDLAVAIVALRDERGSLASVEELRILPGMDDASLARVRRHTSVTLDLPVQKNRRAYTKVEEVLAQFNQEPSVADVQQMAMEYSHTHRHQVEAWLEASKSAAYLPELQLRYYYYDRMNTGYEYVVDEQGNANPDPADADTDRDHVYQVTLKWKLDDLVMSSERIRVISEAQDVVKLRDKVLGEVTRVYFDRRRLQVDSLLSPSGDIKSQVENQLRLMELTAELDALTGGRFSRALAAK